jgi:hypothetical protein
LFGDCSDGGIAMKPAIRELTTDELDRVVGGDCVCPGGCVDEDDYFPCYVNFGAGGVTPFKIQVHC